MTTSAATTTAPARQRAQPLARSRATEDTMHHHPSALTAEQGLRDRAAPARRGGRQDGRPG